MYKDCNDVKSFMLMTGTPADGFDNTRQPCRSSTLHVRIIEREFRNIDAGGCMKFRVLLMPEAVTIEGGYAFVISGFFGTIPALLSMIMRMLLFVIIFRAWYDRQQETCESLGCSMREVHASGTCLVH